MPAPTSRLAAALLGAALLLAASGPASARSPSSAERGSLDWLLSRLAKDRDEEKSAPARVDPVELYAKGTTPLDDWKPLQAILMDNAGKGRTLARERAVGGLLERFKLEDERKTVDARILDATKKKILLSVIDLMLDGDDNTGRNCVHRFQLNWFPQIGVAWSPGDPPARRQKAYKDLKQKLSR